ncbi:MAG: hypothetical protein IJF36_04810 [Oscillibacter sp.]|nr:hypothetical protein [Oscillibacter sp.]
MEQNNRPGRRVGTLTMGMVLVVSGACMLAGMFFPTLDLTVVLQLSPVILISLGIETLLSARKDGKVRYDWVGMILCALLVCTAVCLYALTYTMVWHPEWFQYWY